MGISPRRVAGATKTLFTLAAYDILWYNHSKEAVMPRVSVIACIIFLFLAQPGFAEPTTVIVHVKAKGSKFIGTSVGGARVTIRDTRTGDMLAEGITSGSTGDTNLIMHTCRKESEPIADGSAAKFSAVLNIDRPVYAEIKAYGPLSAPQAASEASVRQWLLPGKDVVQGDALLLELSGLIVEINDAGKEIHIPEGKKSLQISIPVSVTTL